MKKVIILFLILALSLCASAVWAKAAPKPAEMLPNYNYTLVGSFEVKGRQGIATDGEYYYVSGSKALYKYDKTGKLLLANENPSRDMDPFQPHWRH